jgi:hypothetical protein
MNIVIAGSYRQYKTWVLQNDLDPKEFEYIHHPEQLFGLRDYKYVLVGCYWENEVFSSDIFIGMVYAGQLSESWVIKDTQ